MVEGARLESVFRGNSNVGSNPTLSASSLVPLKPELHPELQNPRIFRRGDNSEIRRTQVHVWRLEIRMI